LEERRKYSRWEARDRSVVIVQGAQRKEVPLVNLSASGMKIICSEEWACGSKIAGELSVLRHHAPYIAEGRVIWTKRIAEEKSLGFETGVAFEKITVLSRS
jgi:hypothetical protein